MTQFDRYGFRQETSYIFYNNKFVARFQYQKSAIGSFIKFLRKNFTVEEYFDRIKAGESPAEIVHSKGYIFPPMRRFLRERGYEDNIEGYNRYRFDMNRKMK